MQRTTGKWRVFALTAVLAVGLGVMVAASDALGMMALAAVAVVAVGIPLTQRLGFGRVVLLFVATRPLADAYVTTRLGPISVGEAWALSLLFLTGSYLLLSRAWTRLTIRDVFVPALLWVQYVFVAVLLYPSDRGLEYAFRLLTVLLTLGLTIAVLREQDTFGGRAEVICQTLTLMSVASLVPVARAVSLGQYGDAYYFNDSFAWVTQGPHVMSAMLVLLLPGLIVCLQLRSRYSVARTILVSLMLVAIVGSYVRTSAVGLLIVLATFAFGALTERRTRTARVVGTIMVAITALFAGVTLIAPRALERLTGLAVVQGGVVNESAGSGRVGIWLSVLRGGSQSFLTFFTGAGATASTSYTSVGTAMYVYAHNDFLEMFATGGIFLAAVYVLFVGWMLAAALRARRWLGSDNRPRIVGLGATAGVAAFTFMSAANGQVMAMSSLAVVLLIGFARVSVDQLAEALPGTQEAT